MRLNFGLLSVPISRQRGHAGTRGTASNHEALNRPHTPEYVGDTWGQIATPIIERLADILELSPLSPIHPQAWGHGKPCIHAAVPAVPDVPAKRHANEIDREAFEERAAIMEFDGELSRHEAERYAAVYAQLYKGERLRIVEAGQTVALHGGMND